MHVHHAVAALRRDPGSQRRSCARMAAAKAAWLARESEVSAALEAYDRGERLAELLPLLGLFQEPETARVFVEGFTRGFIEAQRAEPLGEVPLRHGSSAGFSRLQLMQSGGTVLSLCTYEPVASPRAAPSIRFVDCDLDEIVIAGSARGFVHRLCDQAAGTAQVTSTAHSWQAGDRIEQMPLCEAREYVAVKQTLLVLQLGRTPQDVRPSTEYRLSDGALVQQVSGDRRASEQVMALGVLGALEHLDGLPAIECFARELANDPDARWEAVRQTLALDPARGMQLLGGFGPGDPLARPALELREQLIATHPALQELIPEFQ